MALLQLDVVGERFDHRIEHLEQAAWYRLDQADRIADVELHRAGARESPVHGEGFVRPVGLDYAVEAHDAVLRVVGRPAHHQIPALGRAEEIGNRISEYARAEVRGEEARVIAAQDLDSHVFLPRAAVPG